MTHSNTNDPRAEFIDLAKRLANPDGFALLRDLQYFKLLGGANETLPPPAKVEETLSGDELHPISIWEPKQTDAGWIFARPQPGPFGDHFADRIYFSVQKPPDTLRIAFFGESVAAGYLYAPHLTPAKLLESALAKTFPNQAIEVLDFSRTNETLGTMIETVKAAVQTQPDLNIFFAGNNWPLLEMTDLSPFLPSVPVRQTLAKQWESGRMAGVKDAEQVTLRARVGSALNDLGQWLTARDLAAIWVIPEVNLLDWDHGQPPPFLESSGQKKWYELLGKARIALAEKEFAKAIACGWAMLELDDGTSPIGYRVLGLAHYSLGDIEKAEAAFRYEVQATGYSGSCFLGAPQVTTQIQKLITLVCKRHGIETVDLAEVFAAIRPGHLPDRHFFLDYCHLTKEGMDAVTGALLEPVARKIGLSVEQIRPASWLGEIDPALDATAYLGAAIHSCHRQFPSFSQQRPWDYWLEKAIANHPDALQQLMDYVEIRLSHAPPIFSKRHERNAERSFPLSPQHGLFYEYIDAPILWLLMAYLDQKEPKLHRQWVEKVLSERDDLGVGVDLIDSPYYLWEPLARFLPEVMTNKSLCSRAFMRCPWPETKFALIANGASRIELILIARQGGGEFNIEKGEVRIGMNGKEIGKVALSELWKEHRLIIERKSIQAGLNQLVLHWPIAKNMDGGQMVAKNLRLGREASFHPHFGEIYSLKLRYFS